jgi:hypothetical protein
VAAAIASDGSYSGWCEVAGSVHNCSLTGLSSSTAYRVVVAAVSGDWETDAAAVGPFKTP